MSGQAEVAVLDAAAAANFIAELADVLADCVAGGASVSFMQPFGREDGVAYFRKVVGEIERGETLLLAARLDGRIVGTVQLGLAMPPNQPHRGDIRKLLVHRAARRQGIASALMLAVEAEARRPGRTTLFLDTRAGDPSERLYASLGYTRVGEIPQFARSATGALDATAFYYKLLVP